MEIYQLIFKGQYAYFGGKAKIHSKKVYRNKKDITEEVIEEFINLCCDGGGLYDIEKDTVEVKIVELHLQ